MVPPLNSVLLALCFFASTEGLSKTLDDISYYGHKWAREGGTFIIVCFSLASTNISWTKNGWPVEFVFADGYTTSERLHGVNGKLSTFLVGNAQAQHAGKYRCSNRSTSFHELSVHPYQSRSTMIDCLTAIPNEPLRLPCNIPLTNMTASTVIWYKDSKPYIPDARSTFFPTSLEIRGTREDDAGTYSCSLLSTKTPPTDLFRVVAPIRIMPFPSAIEAHWGDSLHIPCRARSFPQPHIEWYKGNDLVPSDKDLADPHIHRAVLSLRKIDHENAGIYRCVASHGLCGEMVAQRALRLRVRENRLRTNEEYPGLGITLDPASESLRLSCFDASDPAAPIKWMRGDKDLDTYPVQHKFTRDPVDQSLIIHNPNSDDVDNYTCLAPKTGEKVVILVGLKAEIHQQATPASGRVVGKKLYMHCKVSGYPLPVVRWFRNNRLVHIGKMRRFNYRAAFGVFPDTLEIAALSKEDNGIYSCTADNGHSYDMKIFRVDVKSKMDAFVPFLIVCGEVILACILVLKYLDNFQRGLDVPVLTETQQPAPLEPGFQEMGQQSAGQPQVCAKWKTFDQPCLDQPQEVPQKELAVQSPEQFRSSKASSGIKKRKKFLSLEHTDRSVERLIHPSALLEENETDFKFQRTLTEKERASGMTLKPVARTSFSKKFGNIEFSLGMIQMGRPMDNDVPAQVCPTPFTFSSTKAKPLSPSTTELLPPTASYDYATLSAKKATVLQSTVHSSTAMSTTTMTVLSEPSNLLSSSMLSTAQQTERPFSSTAQQDTLQGNVITGTPLWPPSTAVSEQSTATSEPPVLKRDMPFHVQPLHKVARKWPPKEDQPACAMQTAKKDITVAGTHVRREQPCQQSALATIIEPKAAPTIDRRSADKKKGGNKNGQDRKVVRSKPRCGATRPLRASVSKASESLPFPGKLPKAASHAPSIPHDESTQTSIPMAQVVREVRKAIRDSTQAMVDVSTTHLDEEGRKPTASRTEHAEWKISRLASGRPGLHEHNNVQHARPPEKSSAASRMATEEAPKSTASKLTPTIMAPKITQKTSISPKKPSRKAITKASADKKRTLTKSRKISKWNVLRGIKTLFKRKSTPDEPVDENLPSLVIPDEQSSSSSEDSDEWVARLDDGGCPFEVDSMDSAGFETHISESAERAHRTRDRPRKSVDKETPMKMLSGTTGDIKRVNKSYRAPYDRIETTEGFAKENVHETATADTKKQIVKGTNIGDSIKSPDAYYPSWIGGHEDQTQDKPRRPAMNDGGSGETLTRGENRSENAAQKESSTEKESAEVPGSTASDLSTRPDTSISESVELVQTNERSLVPYVEGYIVERSSATSQGSEVSTAAEPASECPNSSGTVQQVMYMSNDSRARTPKCFQYR